MKILLADTLSETCIRALSEEGHQVVSKPQAKGAELIEVLKEEKPEVLVVRSTKVPAEAMDVSPSLELIVRAGAGYDNIDVDAASRRGIFVSNCPGKNAAAVAELAMGLILALDRYIPENVADAREGRWNKAKYSKAEGVKGKTLGIIGLGNIGKELVRRARGFDVRIIAWSRSLTDEEAGSLGISRKASPMDVAREADIVSIHVAGTPDTKHLANRAFFEAMKPGALFINTSRASVVDEEALQWAIKEKGIRAGLDVIDNEPAGKEGAFEHLLTGLPGVYLTHHIGASTEQAQAAIADEAVRVIVEYARTGRAPNTVNLAEHSAATHLLTVRHVDQVGVLASVLDEVRRAGWNVQEMENLIFAGGDAALARIRFDGEPDEDVLRRIGEQAGVLAASVISLDGEE
jgi:D-3-phosphoglycerate dehydrogenase